MEDRVNIVLTSDKNYKVKGAVAVHTLRELLEELEKYSLGEVFVIGGESVYRQMLPYCDTAYVTKVNHAYDADTYFPDLDGDSKWRMTKVSDEQTYFDLEYEFRIYEREKEI